MQLGEVARLMSQANHAQSIGEWDVAADLWLKLLPIEVEIFGSGQKKQVEYQLFLSERALSRNEFVAARDAALIALEMAKKIWVELKANDSAECRSCHTPAAMAFKQQPAAAADAHSSLATSGLTCIDCHTGVAHTLPPGS